MQKDKLAEILRVNRRKKGRKKNITWTEKERHSQTRKYEIQLRREKTVDTELLLSGALSVTEMKSAIRVQILDENLLFIVC